MLGAVHRQMVVGAGKWLCGESTIVMNTSRQPTWLYRGALLIREKTSASTRVLGSRENAAPHDHLRTIGTCQLKGPWEGAVSYD